MSGGAWLSLIVTLLVGALFLLMVWETARLLWRRIPLTGLVRYDEAHVRMRWIVVGYFVAGGVVGWLLDHFAHF